MCGRIVWRFDRQMQQWVKSWLADEEAYEAALRRPAVATDRYNINPGATVAVARIADGHPLLEARKWAFPVDGRYLFNTRIETAFTSPMWREPATQGRCVVPVTGFYEWKASGSRRQPFFIRRRDAGPLLLAGVSGWREHRGEQTPCCSIVTRPPDEVMAPLHDRMPVVLGQDDVAAWLDPDARPTALTDLARAAGTVLEAFPVSTRVNDQSHDGADLIEPLPTLGDL